jgi:hypothetical protein
MTAAEVCIFFNNDFLSLGKFPPPCARHDDRRGQIVLVCVCDVCV